MNNPKTTSFEEKVYMATRVPGPSPEFAEHLWKQVVEQPQKQSGFNTHFPRIFARPVWAASTIVLLVTVVLITTLGPGQVWAAVQKLIGYIPGIGFVENNEATLILSQPVTNTRGQVSVTVVNAVASIDNTRIILQADGLNGLRKYVQDNRPESSGSLRLLQPDGSSIPLKSISVEYVSASAVEVQMNFQPLSTGVREVTLAFTQIPGVPAGFAPESWQISLDFQAANTSGRITTGSEPNFTSETVNGLTLVLSGIAQLDGKTALELRLDTNDPFISIEPNWWWNNILIYDINGNLVSVGDDPIVGDDGWAEITLEMSSLDAGQLYTLNLNGPIGLWEQFEQNPQLEFTFDPGPEPHFGQHWEMDETLIAGGRGFHLTSISLYSNEASKPALLFNIDHQKDVEGVMIFPLDHQPASGAVGVQTVVFEEIPQEPIRFRLGGVFYQMDGAWQISFQIPEGGTSATTKP